MKWTSDHTKLRQALTYLFEDSDSARRIARQAGVPTASISFSPNANNNWQAILEEAMKHNLVPAIITVAADEFPASTELSEAASAFLPGDIDDLERTMWFPLETLHAIHSLLISADLSTATAIDGLLVGMNPSFVAMLPTAGAPAQRLFGILNQLNRTQALTTGEIPMAMFLSNAVVMSSPRQESVKLKSYLEQVRA